MRRADRLFDIVQTLRAAGRPLTAAALADQLEVTVRTIYRDIAALQASCVPVEGAPVSATSCDAASICRR
jgi:predicted DNA-binding transcriptional regulator YafY